MFRILNRIEFSSDVKNGVFDASIAGKDYVFETGNKNNNGLELFISF